MKKKSSSVKRKNLKNSIFNLQTKNKRIKKIYERFEFLINQKEFKGYLVGVSGGADSLALAYLAKVYSIKKKISSRFFIVDHKLRPESTKEAKTVSKVLKKILVKPEILTWKGKKPLKNIQSKARVKRYDLLTKNCEKFKITNILLGHHQDDLFENFFIRFSRGSGLKGLVSLDKKSKISNKNLIRPLINEKKEVFSMNKIWDKLIKEKNLQGLESNQKFYHLNTSEMYRKIQSLNIID